MKRYFSLYVAILLAACVQAPLPEKNLDTQFTDESLGEIVSSSPGEEIPVTGSGALPERILANGILEIGNLEAPLTLLEFTEYHCLYCKTFHQTHVPEILIPLIKEGRLQYQIAILTLEKYPNSASTALATLCAAEQEQGWNMHSMLMEREETNAEAISGYAKELGLIAEDFENCMQNQDMQTLLDAQKQLADSLNVSLVPTLFLNGEKSIGLPYPADLKGWLALPSPRP